MLSVKNTAQTSIRTQTQSIYALWHPSMLFSQEWQVKPYVRLKSESQLYAFCIIYRSKQNVGRMIVSTEAIHWCVRCRTCGGWMSKAVQLFWVKYLDDWAHWNSISQEFYFLVGRGIWKLCTPTFILTTCWFSVWRSGQWLIGGPASEDYHTHTGK